jgi:hypothetical protein
MVFAITITVSTSILDLILVVGIKKWSHTVETLAKAIIRRAAVRIAVLPYPKQGRFEV